LIRHIEECLEAGKFGFVKLVEAGVGKPPKEQVDFAHAAVPDAETQAFAAHVEFLAPEFRLAYHWLSTSPATVTAVNIAAPINAVVVPAITRFMLLSCWAG
jgi:hypothetical protein